MILRLWLRLAMYHLFLLFSIVSILLVILIEGLGYFTWNAFFRAHLYYWPIWTIIVSLIFVISFCSAFFFARGLSEPYEQLHAKVNWLILGKYRHHSFEQHKKSPNWFEPSSNVDQDLVSLRDKMLQLTTDLQEFSAAPTFVGNETKEEIIEQERQRIARELHDSVSQQLFASMMMLSAINETSAKNLPEMTQKQLAKIEEIVNNAQTEMRALLLHLRPIALADKTLKEGINQLLNELKPKIPHEVSWELDDIRMESGIEDHLFRIVQEAISNTLRHAKASKFEVLLHEIDGNIQLKIFDDGKGFDINAHQKVGSYGILNMKERIASLGGDIRIMSLPQQGTVIDIKIPIERKIIDDKSISS
ncbi:sensor histidine kinase [Aerococcaceae bacterium zg-BR9]|uniref:sensor histidine kinase n=1 Tax=Aerococcaceae bacterium zg-1292 TaxID=2774330 RepID=UPI00406494BD|nr:sensor histidine kinase [Aerococcaceae bacterium zg-BR9]